MKTFSLRTAILVLAVAVAGLFAIPAAASAAPARPAAATSAAGSLVSEVTGTFTDATGGTGAFTGTFTPSRFTADGSRTVADGVLAGTLVDSQGRSQAVSQPQTFAVAGITASCQVLDLNLAPLDLNLLGLTVHLDRVHLNITAVPGAGNLLGNLLCALTNLLNGAGTASQIAALLNQILGLLGL